MRLECSGGDGIHLSGQSYEDLLNAVYEVMDTMPIPAAVMEVLEYTDDSTTQTEVSTEESLSDETSSAF